MEELPELRFMNFTVTCGRRGRDRSSRIGELILATDALQDTLNLRVSVGPISLVLGLLLNPLYALSVLILLKLILNLVPREG